VSTGRKLYNLAAFQAGWFACVLGAARGNLWIGPIVVAILLVAHLGITHRRRGEWKLLACSLPLGLVVNAVLQSSGAVVAPGPWTGPVWLLFLWPLFATLFGESMSWMRGRYALGVAFGAVGAPLSYFGGERLGALALHDNAFVWIPLVIVTWSTVLVVLLALQTRLTPTVRA